MDPFIEQLKADLLKMEVDDRSLTNVLRVKKEVDSIAGSRLAADPTYGMIASLVKGVPSGATCACCGKTGLVDVRRKEGKIVGNECVHHDWGDCRRANRRS